MRWESSVISKKANRLLRDFTPFQDYIAHIASRKKEIPSWHDDPKHHLGVFQAVRKQQLDILGKPEDKTPYSTRVSLRAKQKRSAPQCLSESSGSRDDIDSNRTAAEDAPGPKLEPTRDEEMVNIALLGFLQALTMNIPAVACEWSPWRTPFKPVQFAHCTMEARTDVRT